VYLVLRIILLYYVFSAVLLFKEGSMYLIKSFYGWLIQTLPMWIV